MRLIELAERVGGELEGDGAIEISGVAGIREAREGDITFLGHARYQGFLPETKASAVILDPGCDADVASAVIRNDNPYLAFQKAMTILFGEPYAPAPGIHATAIIAPDVTLGRNVSLGPHVVIEPGCTIGDGVAVQAGSYIGHEVTIGDDTRVFPNVTIRERTSIGARCLIHAGAVIGDDGFGLTKDGAENRKVPQIGRVVIEDDVEIGSNACVDRATMGETRIRTGARIDNLVQVAHNVTIGEHAILCAQVGIAGSSIVGRNAILAGQAGISGHLEIGEGAQIAAQAGVIGDIPAGQRASGYPARPHGEQMRLIAATRRIPELLQRIDALERRLSERETESGR